MASARRVMNLPLQKVASGGILAPSPLSVQSGGEHDGGRLTVAGARRTGQGPTAPRLSSRRGAAGPFLDARRDRSSLQGPAGPVGADATDHEYVVGATGGLQGRDVRGGRGGG